MKVNAPMRAATLQMLRPRLIRFVAIALFASTFDAPLALGQSLIADPARLVLGAGHVSEVLVGQIRLCNTSQEPVMLYAVEPSCDSCTEVLFTNGWIEPGASSEVEVRLRCEKSNATKLVQSITVHCSDRERPKFKIVLEGQFLPAVVIRTPRIDLGTVIAASRLRVEIEASNWTSNPIRLVAAEETYGLSEASRELPVSPRSEAGPGMVSLGLVVEAPRTTGPHRWRFTWLTGVESQPTVDVEVVAMVTARPEFAPRVWIPVPGGAVLRIGLGGWRDPTAAAMLTGRGTEVDRAVSLMAAGACAPQPMTEATSTQSDRGVQ